MSAYITDCGKRGDKAIAVDDTVLVSGIQTTAGSKMLEGFVPLFDAEAVTRLKNAGYEVSGKASVGEFGLDLLGETAHGGGYTDDSGRLRGAAAALVAGGEVHGALCVDLNGTPRRAAQLGGVVFVKPTYGTVSRYGVIPCACSGEQIGVMARTAGDAAELLAVIAGRDEKDGTSIPNAKYEYKIGDSVAGLRIGIPTEYLDMADDEISANVRKFAEVMSAGGASVEEFSLPEAELAAPAWQILMSAETCNNLSRYDGVKFGHRTKDYADIDSLYVGTRSEGFGLNTKTVILYGSDVLSKDRYIDCYDKSMRVRRVLKNKVDEVFAKYDCVLSPACFKMQYLASDVNTQADVYAESRFTALASITGIPAVVAGGVQLMGNSFSECSLLTAAACFERGSM